MRALLRTITSVAVLFAIPSIARAEEATRSLIVGTKIGVRAARDDTLVPIASTGPTLDFYGRFLGSLGHSLVDTELRLGAGVLFDRDRRPALAFSHGMHVAVLPIVHRDAEAWTFAVGPLLAWETDIFFFAKWDDAHGYWMGRRFLGASARAFRSVSPRLRLDIAGELSLVGLESRPPERRLNKQDAMTHPSYFFADVNRDAELGWLADFQAFRLDIDLHRVDRKGMVPSGFGIGLGTRVAHSSRPASAFLIETTIRLEHAWSVP